MSFYKHIHFLDVYFLKVNKIIFLNYIHRRAEPIFIFNWTLRMTDAFHHEFLRYKLSITYLIFYG